MAAATGPAPGPIGVSEGIDAGRILAWGGRMPVVEGSGTVGRGADGFTAGSICRIVEVVVFGFVVDGWIQCRWVAVDDAGLIKSVHAMAHRVSDPVMPRLI